MGYKGKKEDLISFGDMFDLVRNITEFLETEHKTPKWLAGKLGISWATLRNWLARKYRPTYEMRDKIYDFMERWSSHVEDPSDIGFDGGISTSRFYNVQEEEWYSTEGYGEFDKFAGRKKRGKKKRRYYLFQ